MKLNLSVKEIVVSYLHIMLETVLTISSSTSILKDKVSNEISPQINVINKVSVHLWDTIQDLYRNPEKFFDLDSASKSALQFKELSMIWKQELQIIANAVKEIESKQVKGFRIEEPLLNAILLALPKALARSETYVQYFSVIKEEDFLIWDEEKVRKIYSA